MPAQSELEADLCIIGAGAAGITIARELAGSSVRVALLESGGMEFDAGTQSLYEGTLTGLPYFPLDAARLRYFGGTTNHWGGVCRPFDDEDFEPKDWIPNTGWPIRSADVDPFYGRAGEIAGLRSEEWSLAEWQEHDSYAPLPLDAARIGARIAQVVPRARRSFGERYREELGLATNVTVYLYANATEIETDEGGTLAGPVRIATLTGNRFSVRARLVVVAVGGIENARLLLASRSRLPNGLGNEHDLVGRFFLEHPRFRAGVVAPSDANLSVGFYEDHSVAGSKLTGYASLSRDVQRREELTDVQIRIEPVYTDAFERALASQDVDAFKSLARRDDFSRSVRKVADDVMSWQTYVVAGTLLPVPYPEVVRKALRASSADLQSLVPQLLGDIAGFAYRELTGGAPLEALVLTTRIEPAPNPDSRITLSAQRDPLGVPRVELDWRLSEIDRRSAVRAVEVVAAEVGRVGLGRLRMIIDGNDSGWPDDLAGGWHLMGTTRMSDDPRRGVVDRDCKVHGVDNLFVAGSSVFPSAGSGTPTLLLVALALRLAAHLKGMLR